LPWTGRRGRQKSIPPSPRRTKRGKVREVPLPERVGQALAAHMEQFPPRDVTLPWLVPGGEPVTKKLLFTTPDGGALLRQNFNERSWKPALVTAGVLPRPTPGKRIVESREDDMHALRHFYASVLLDGGENVKALSRYLGHSDPGFTLQVYTHLMPSSESRTRKAVDGMYLAAGGGNDGPQTAHRRPTDGPEGTRTSGKPAGAGLMRPGHCAL
jgi:integrase